MFVAVNDPHSSNRTGGGYTEGGSRAAPPPSPLLLDLPCSPLEPTLHFLGERRMMKMEEEEDEEKKNSIC